MKTIISKRLIRIAIATITSLLVLNFILTRSNNQIIEENRSLQSQAVEIKTTVSQFAIIIIHNLDLGLRSYALFNDEKYLYPLHIAVKQKDSIINVVQQALTRQGYPLEEFHSLKDSIDAYAMLNLQLVDLFKANQMGEFYHLANQDKGYHLWLQYEKLAKKIYEFEDEITRTAFDRYTKAEYNNYLIQLLLFLICVPTLLITSYHTYKKFAFEVKLRKAEEEKAFMLATQNEKLEQAVDERTQELQQANRMLQIQHEEISAQNEEITAQNDELCRQREELVLNNQALRDSKQQQLDIYSQSLMEKSELINHLNEEIELLKKLPTPNHEQVEKFSKVLHSTILTNEDWEKYKKIFEEVYPNFFASLRYRFPDITASELRLAALIKMNLSLREAADTLGISAESVKKSRYRLKKKIAIGEDDSLEEFIRSL
ncbi:MAG: hypothetical protein ABI663_13535 [Chryseolinea sp.]